MLSLYAPRTRHRLIVFFAASSQLFGDIPAPNLYHQAKKQTVASPTSSFYSTHNDHPSSTSLARVSTNTTHRSSTEVLDFLRD